MNTPHRGDHCGTRFRLLPHAARAALDNAATRVSTQLGEERVALPRRPTLVHRALLRFDGLSPRSRSYDNDFNQRTATGLDIPLTTPSTASLRATQRDRFV